MTGHEVSAHQSKFEAFPAINGDFKGKDILLKKQFDQQSLNILSERASRLREISDNELSGILPDPIVSLIFYDPDGIPGELKPLFKKSIEKLGGSTISQSSGPHLLSEKIRTAFSYSDLIVLDGYSWQEIQNEAVDAVREEELAKDRRRIPIIRAEVADEILPADATEEDRIRLRMALITLVLAPPQLT